MDGDPLLTGRVSFPPNGDNASLLAHREPLADLAVERPHRFEARSSNVSCQRRSTSTAGGSSWSTRAAPTARTMAGARSDRSTAAAPAPRLLWSGRGSEGADPGPRPCEELERGLHFSGAA